MSNIPDSVSTFRPPHMDFRDDGSSMITRGLSHFGDALGDGSRVLEETRLLDKKNKQLVKLTEFEQILSRTGIDLSSDEKLEALPLPDLLPLADREYTVLKDKYLAEMPVVWWLATRSWLQASDPAERWLNSHSSRVICRPK